MGNMNFYFVKPVDGLHSRRWIVDEAGLELVENHYRSYPDKNGGTYDRWADFNAEVCTFAVIDFGGMISLNTPIVNINIDQMKFDVLVTHLPTLVESLTMPSLLSDGLWKCGIWQFIHVYSDETRLRILDIASKLLKDREEMIEGYNRAFDEDLARINKDGVKVIRKTK